MGIMVEKMIEDLEAEVDRERRSAAQGEALLAALYAELMERDGAETTQARFEFALARAKSWEDGPRHSDGSRYVLEAEHHAVTGMHDINGVWDWLNGPAEEEHHRYPVATYWIQSVRDNPPYGEVRERVVCVTVRGKNVVVGNLFPIPPEEGKGWQFVCTNIEAMPAWEGLPVTGRTQRLVMNALRERYPIEDRP